jgi:hypothetical protein
MTKRAIKIRNEKAGDQGRLSDSDELGVQSKLFVGYFSRLTHPTGPTDQRSIPKDFEEMD